MKSCPTCRNDYPVDLTVCPADGAPLLEPGTWPQGILVNGQYRILESISRGEIGEVYKAVRRGSSIPLALKVMSADLMDDERLVRRFKQEAHCAREFVHPNAVHVEDVHEADDGRPFVAMEYIAGESLGAVLQREERLGVWRACSIVRQVASALEAAHRLGMVHQDLKPDTIMLVGSARSTSGRIAPAEEVKVLNWFLARIKEERRRDLAAITLKQTHRLMGRPAYFSPEQVLGKRGDELDGRSDLYALGVLLYRMLTGRLPFPDLQTSPAHSAIDALLAHLLTAPSPMSELQPELPEPIANLVMRMIEKKRALRPPSARTIIEELEHAEKAGTRDQGSAVGERPRAESRDTTGEAAMARVGTVQPEHVNSGLLIDPAPEPHLVLGERSKRQRAVSGDEPSSAEPRSEDLQPATGKQQPRSRPFTPDSGPLTRSVLGLSSAYQPPPATNRSSRGRMAGLAAVLAITLGAIVLYFPALRSAFLRVMHVVSTSRANPSATQASEPKAASPSSAPSSTENAGPDNAGPVGPSSPSLSWEEGSKSAEASTGKDASPSLASRVKSAVAAGDRLYEVGNYDGAIAAYTSAQKLDPTNQELRAQIERARAAKAAEAKELPH